MGPMEAGFLQSLSPSGAWEVSSILILQSYCLGLFVIKMNIYQCIQVEEKVKQEDAQNKS
jgi:hypothetical protein